jgi:hypothetical protein
MQGCLSCSPGLPEILALDIAVKKANEESKKYNCPIAVYQEGSEFKTKNAFTAYAEKLIVRAVISTHNGTSPV